MTTTGISRRELARRHDIHESTVRRHVDSGALADALFEDGTLDPRKASELLRRVLTAAHVVPRDLADARLRRLRAQVAKAEREVVELRAATIAPQAAARIVAGEMGIVARHLREVPSRARLLAGKPASEAQRGLRGLLFDALAAISDEATEDEWWNDPLPPPPVDLVSLSSNAVQARRIDLAAQALELETDIARGDLLLLQNSLAAFETALGTIKAGLLALPSRMSQEIAAADEGSIEHMLSSEIEELLADAPPTFLAA